MSTPHNMNEEELKELLDLVETSHSPEKNELDSTIRFYDNFIRSVESGQLKNQDTKDIILASVKPTLERLMAERSLRG
jgi:hypothetical protein